MEPFIQAAVEKHHAEAVALSDDLYAHPEPPEEEFRSSEKIVTILRAVGYEVEYPYMGYPTGFRGVMRNGDGPSAGILVEYDALPGLGHACGHNAHGSMAVLAALAMAELRDRFQGTVYVFGTPAEEANGAKLGMSAGGAFDDLSLAIMIHTWSGGKSIADMDLLSMRQYVMEFRGKEAHAVAGPWEGHSALAAARKFLDLVDARRECFTPDIFVNSVITNGGAQPNILPGLVELRCEFRTGSMSGLEKLDEIVLKCANAAAMALDCEVSWKKAFEDFADMVRVPELEQEAVRVLHALGQETAEVQRASGSSDIGNTSYRCPSIQPMLSICDTFHALHTPEHRDSTIEPKAHEAIAVGARLIASMVFRTLTDETFRESVYRSFLEQRKRKTGVN